MPVLTTRISAAGPIVELAIGVSARRRIALQAVGRQIQPTVIVRGLIDTGASCTCLDPSVIAKLELEPTGIGSILGASSGGTPQFCNQYDVALALLMDDRQAHLITLTLPIVEVLLEN